MANSYTWPIKDGSDTSLRGYLMRIGRAMDYASHQRDESHGPVRPGTVDGYYEKQIDEENRKIAKLIAMTPSEVADAVLRAHRDATRVWEEIVEEAAAERARFQSMLQRVWAWQPASPLVETTKDVAVRYLEESIAHDDVSLPSKPSRLNADAWLSQELAEMYRHRASVMEARDRHEASVASRNRYVEAFLASLPPEGV